MSLSNTRCNYMSRKMLECVLGWEYCDNCRMFDDSLMQWLDERDLLEKEMENEAENIGVCEVDIKLQGGNCKSG